MVEEEVAKGTAIVRDEMQIMETRLTSQTKNFATYYAEKALGPSNNKWLPLDKL